MGFPQADVLKDAHPLVLAVPEQCLVVHKHDLAGHRGEGAADERPAIVPFGLGCIGERQCFLRLLR